MEPAGRDLEGRVAIVTGATSGIGAASAHALKQRGARVLAVGRDTARLAELQATGFAAVAASLADPASWDDIVAAARRLGPVTILVSSAGRPGYIDLPIFDQSTEEWRETMAVNLDAPFELSRRIVHDIRSAGWGRIVMVSSTAGARGAPAMSPYCASKHGVIGLMRSIAQDIGPCGATCNAVLPGWVRTAMAERDAEREAARRGLAVDAVWAERAASYPAGRVLSAAEVARVIGFLVSDAASGINGAAIDVTLGGFW